MWKRLHCKSLHFFLKHTMATISSSAEEKFLRVTNKSEFFPVVKEELEKRKSIYGNQDPSIRKIEEGSDRLCELLLKEAKPVTLLIYKTEPVTKSDHVEVSNSLEIKTFLPIDKNSIAVDNLKKTLDRALEIAKEKKAKNIHLTCSEREKFTFHFLVNNNFQVCETWDGKYVDGVKEYMMYKSVDGAEVNRDSSCNDAKVETVSTGDTNSAEKGGSSKRHFNDNDRGDHKRRRHDGDRGHSSNKDKNFDSCTLMKKYIYYIRDGKKTVEARLNTPMFQKWREGMIIRFHCRSPVDVHVKITEVKRYKTFREMLEGEGYKNCVPDVYSVNEGVQAYLRIPNYRDKEHLGVLAFRIQKVDKPRY